MDDKTKVIDDRKKMESISYLTDFIKEKKYTEFVYIFNRSVSLKLISKKDVSLMYTAVIFENVQIITFLYTVGFDINACSFLKLAVINNSYQAVHLLLILGVDILIANSDGQSNLRFLLEKRRELPQSIIELLFEKMRDSNLSPHEIADELVKAKCSYEFILTYNDARVTQEVMTRYSSELNEDLGLYLLKKSMYTRNIENTRVLLQYGNEMFSRREWFVRKVMENMFNYKMKPFFEQLINWDLIEDDQMEEIDDKFYNSSEDYVRAYLDIGIDKYCREKFGKNLLLTFLDNPKVDVVKLLNKFDINGRDNYGDTALHRVIDNIIKKDVVFLLNNGADPNIKNEKGETPLFMVRENEEFAKLLLKAGGDIQVTNNDNKCALCYWTCKDFAIIHFILLQAQGVPIKDTTSRWIHEHYQDSEDLLKMYEKYNQDVEWMKTRWVSEAITLFSVFKENFECLANYVKNDETCDDIINAACHERALQPRLVTMMMKNLKKARGLNEVKIKAATFLYNAMQVVGCSSDHLVISIIIGFLTYEDLQVFNEM